ncbi:MAG: GNAT family N-acetyltransferase [Leptolyngbya sp. SIOISBB]|nr:GNAT family N-acetyltransferase [Leptolyngbya sp. SIOISBB]
MFVRVAQSTDIETLFDIRTSVTENYQSREEIAELGITPESIAEMLATDCCAWIADLEGQAVGFAIANVTEATIFGIFIRPAFEGKGAGRALMQAAETWLWSQGLDEIWLLTGNDPTLRAYGFYQHLGWMLSEVVVEGDYAGEVKFIKRCHPHELAS